jgi:hypothetical protein
MSSHEHILVIYEVILVLIDGFSLIHIIHYESKTAFLGN